MDKQSFAEHRQAVWRSLDESLGRACHTVAEICPVAVTGTLVKVDGLLMEASGCRLEVGQCCQIVSANGQLIDAEVVGFEGNRSFLAPLEQVDGVTPYARVLPVGRDSSIPVGFELLGRVVDGLGHPIDSGGSLDCASSMTLHGSPVNPFERAPVSRPLDVGVRAINGLLTIGKGQRIGLFSPSGVGKSTLLGMMARNTQADVVVVSLVGERGREVNDFIHTVLDDTARTRTVVVAAPADHTSVMKLRAALLSHRLAEYFRQQGADVLLLMDSLTRYAQARREMALVTGESPALGGYPPSCFSQMCRLVERAGNGPQKSGSITALYTVLVEGDPDTDAVAEAARAILDGHICLSREKAVSGCYPAIDPLSSVSRTMPQTVSAGCCARAALFRQLYSKAQEGHELTLLGVYRPGRDGVMDKALAVAEKMRDYLCQGVDTRVSLTESMDALEHLLSFDEASDAAQRDASQTTFAP